MAKYRIKVDRDYAGNFRATVYKEGWFFWSKLKAFYAAYSYSSDYVESRARNYIEGFDNERTYRWPK